MQKWIQTTVLLFIVTIAKAETISIDFDALPPIEFSVQLEDGSIIEATASGSFVMVSPDGSRLEIPKELVPNNVIPEPGEVPLAKVLPAELSPYATFSTNDNAGLYYFSGGAAVGTSEPNNITAAVDPNAFPYSADLFVDFTVPVSNLSFTVASDNDAGEIAQVAVNYAHGRVAQIPVIGNADVADSILMDLTDFSDVTRIEVLNVTDTFGLSYDDFSFTPTSVPEPSSFLLATVPSLILLVRRQRRTV